MKNELPASTGGVTVNRALPATGVSNVMSMLSDEKPLGESVAEPSMPSTFFKFSFSVYTATEPPPIFTSFTLTVNSNLPSVDAGVNDSIFTSSDVSSLSMRASAANA